MLVCQDFLWTEFESVNQLCVLKRLTKVVAEGVVDEDLKDLLLILDCRFLLFSVVLQLDG